MFRLSWLLIGIALMTLGTCKPSQRTGSDQTDFETALKQGIPTVSYCDLIEAAHKYDGKFVRVHAVYANIGGEYSSFVDPTCKGITSGSQQRPAAWLQFGESNTKRSGPRVMEALGDLMKSQHRADLVVVGKFFGPVTGGYGHLNSYQYKFVVERIEKVEPVSSR